MSVCGSTDRTADRRSKGVINLLFKSKVRLSGLSRLVLCRQVSVLDSLKKFKGVYLMFVCVCVFFFFEDLNIMISITILISTELQNRRCEVQWSIQRKRKSFLKCLNGLFSISLPFKRNKLGTYQPTRENQSLPYLVGFFVCLFGFFGQSCLIELILPAVSIKAIFTLRPLSWWFSLFPVKLNATLQLFNQFYFYKNEQTQNLSWMCWIKQVFLLQFTTVLSKDEIKRGKCQHPGEV